MGKNTKIEWADHTFNPWWGCVKVSEGCKNCYADAFDHRLGQSHWGPTARRKFCGNGYWSKPERWNDLAGHAGEQHRVFCASMCDVFEELPEGHPDTENMEAARWRLWKLIEATPNLDWLLLTKRPQNTGIVPHRWKSGSRGPRNVWLGTTMEDQAAHNDRLPHLLAASWPAKRFISYEPAIGPIAFSGLSEIDWVIVGGESGHRARPMNIDWVRSVRDQCVASGVAFMFKQKVEQGMKMSTPAIDGKVWKETP